MKFIVYPSLFLLLATLVGFAFGVIAMYRGAALWTFPLGLVVGTCLNVIVLARHEKRQDAERARVIREFWSKHGMTVVDGKGMRRNG